ncbi:MAG: F0F1 ATP synthase subunit A [Bacteroidia bacterium]|nr:F0F1 ATP synthase subunit A [Bacteroidia bacterium]MDW8157431.1 F0F1 ATP synthase subunit A [Bacteroidia bacterium]
MYSWIQRLYIFLLLVITSFPLKASDDTNSEKFDISATLFHHVLETHDWHVADIPLGGGEYLSITIPLPWLVYNPQKKTIDFFFLLGHSEKEKNQIAQQKGYVLHHEKLYIRNENVLSPDGKPLPEFEKEVEKIGAVWKPKKGSHRVIEQDGTLIALSDELIDLSPSKTVLHMLLVGILLLIIFSKIAKEYQINKDKPPKGLQSMFEPVIIFIRDEVAKPNLGNRYEAFLPYLLTLFFFIWFSNLLGLLPLSSNIMGNISVTAALATLSLILTNINGSKDYWKHIFWFPGVSLPMKFLMLPVELIGIITKPFSLMIRLFANISAGHFMVLSLISLIFLIGKNGTSAGGTIGGILLAIPFTLFIYCLEFLVAILQAYIFTLLTCVFIGQAMASHEEHH